MTIDVTGVELGPVSKVGALPLSCRTVVIGLKMVRVVPTR